MILSIKYALTKIFLAPLQIIAEVARILAIGRRDIIRQRCFLGYFSELTFPALGCPDFQQKYKS